MSIRQLINYDERQRKLEITGKLCDQLAGVEERMLRKYGNLKGQESNYCSSQVDSGGSKLSLKFQLICNYLCVFYLMMSVL